MATSHGGEYPAVCAAAPHANVSARPEIPPINLTKFQFRTASRETLGTAGMFNPESFRFSIQALRANKIRTLLTSLGLVIGNASVILVVTISTTAREFVLDLLAHFVGVAFDDFTNHAWTSAEISRGDRVEGHPFFDYLRTG